MPTAPTTTTEQCACGNPLLPGVDVKTNRAILACACGYWRFTDTAPRTDKPRTEMKLPGLDRGPQRRQVKELEKRLVEDIRKALFAQGYLVLRVGQWRADKAGNDIATPDLFACRAEWGLFKGLEVKLPGYAPSDVSPEQQHLADIGATVIVVSVEQALAVMAQADARYESSESDG